MIIVNIGNYGIIRMATNVASIHPTLQSCIHQLDTAHVDYINHLTNRIRQI